MPNRGFNESGVKTKRVFDSTFRWTMILAGVILLFIGCLPYIFTQLSSDKVNLCNWEWLKNIDFTNTGQIGDTLGGIMGPFIAMVAAILTYLAFWIQYKANEQQREDIALERFESNLFQMISHQEEITNNLSLSIYSDSGDLEKVKSGRAIFEYLYNERMWNWHKGIRHTISEYGIEKIQEDNTIWCLDHYFRHLYRIFKYINDANVFRGDSKGSKHERQCEYAAIVRSMLSQYELLLLFYNCLAFKENKPFKQLIEKYAVLNNLRCEKLAIEDEKIFYKKYFDSEHVAPINENVSILRYERGAFVRN